MTTEPVPCVKINCPELFQNSLFADWFRNTEAVATWHGDKRRKPHECSDVFVTYDGGEGSDSPESASLPYPEGIAMPEACWEQIDKKCKELGVDYALLWLTNLED